MAQVIASLMATIGADTRGFEQGSKKVKGGMSDIARSIGSVIPTSVMQFASLSGAVGLVGTALKTSIQGFVDYAEQVKNLSRSIGTSAEDASRLIQVADDVRISFASLETATKMAQKQGIDVSIEGLKKLAAQYQSLPSAIERSQFLIKTFGRNGLEMGKLMEKGADGIDAMSKSIEGNLILTKEAIDVSDDYQAAVDTLGDAWKGFLMGPAAGVVKWLGDSAKGWSYQLKLLQLIKEKGVSAFDNEAVRELSAEAYNLVNAEYDLKRSTDLATGAAEDNAGALDTQKEAVKAAEDALKGYEDALDAASQANLDMESMSRSIAESQKDYAKTHKEISDEFMKAWQEGDSEGMAKAQDAIKELEATWHESANNMIYDMVLVGLSAGGLLDSEQRALDEYAIKAGIKTQADIDEANRRREIADSTIAGILQSEDVLAEQRAVDAETLRLQDATTAAAVMTSADQEAQAMANVTLSIDSATRSLMAMAAAAQTTAGAVAGIGGMGGMIMPTGLSKVASDPRRGRGAGVKVEHALGGEFMIPMQYGNEGFALGNYGTASGGETVTITPKGETKGGTTYIFNITNPKREAAEDSIKSALRNLVYTGSAT